MAHETIREIEEFRLRLQKGLHHDLEALTHHCLVFYADMSAILRTRVAPALREVKELIKAYPTASQVLLEYKALCDVEAPPLTHLGAFAAIHCLTHIMEATDAICKHLGVSHNMKRRSYWKFRNRHPHIKTMPHVRSSDDPEGFDLHIFTLQTTSLRNIRHETEGPVDTPQKLDFWRRRK